MVSKTFENFLKARENAEKVAKEKIEALNQMCINKIKKQQMALKKAKGTKDDKKDAAERH